MATLVILAVFNIATMPALIQHVSIFFVGNPQSTYKKPKLMHTMMPTFSFLHICKFQMTSEGNAASTMSITAE